HKLLDRCPSVLRNLHVDHVPFIPNEFFPPGLCHPLDKRCVRISSFVVSCSSRDAPRSHLLGEEFSLAKEAGSKPPEVATSPRDAQRDGAPHKRQKRSVSEDIRAVGKPCAHPTHP